MPNINSGAFTGEAGWRQSLIPALLLIVFVSGLILPVVSNAANGDLVWPIPFPTGGAVNSSPAVAEDGTVYIASQDGNLYAVNPDGTQKWQFATSGPIESSPAIANDGTVYVGSNDKNLYAIYPDGIKKWSYKTEVELKSSPAIGVDGNVYIGSSNYFYAIDSDGSRLWDKVIAGGISYASPSLGTDGTVFIVAGSLEGSTSIQALYPDTGSIKWNTNITGTVTTSSPVFDANGILYLGTQQGKLYAINATDGSAQPWSPAQLGTTINSTPSLAADGMLYVGSDQSLYRIDPATGATTSFYLVGTVNSSPAVGADGNIYIGSNDGFLNVVLPDLSGAAWYRALDGSTVESSPAITANGTVYIATGNGALYAVESDSPGLAASTWPMYRHDLAHKGREPGWMELNWKFRTVSNISSSPAIGQDGTVYVGSEDRRIYAISPEGTLRWSYETGGPVRSSPAIAADGTIYVGSDDGRLYAIRHDGSRRWYYTTGDAVQSSPAIGADGSIYFGSNDNYVYSLSPDGGLQWQFPTGGDVVSSPAIGAGGEIYVGSKDTNLYAISPAGASLWTYSTSGEIWSSPAIGNAIGSIYVASNDKYLHAINPDGSPRWTYNLGISMFRSSPVTASYENVYMGSDVLYMLDGDAGTLIDTFNLAWVHTPVMVNSLLGDVAIVGGQDYALDSDHHIRMVLNWFADLLQAASIKVGSGLDSAPVVGPDGTLYFGANNGYLYSFRTFSTGSPSNFAWPMFRHDMRHTGRLALPWPLVSGPGTISNNGTPTWNWTSNGTSGYFRFAVDNPDLTQYSCIYPDESSANCTTDVSFTQLTDLEDGYHTIYVQEWDISTGTWSNTGGYTVLIDTEPPLTGHVVATSPATTLISLECLDTPLDIASGCDTSYYSLDGISYQPYAGPVEVSLLDNFYYYSTDVAGNQEEVYELSGDHLSVTSLTLSHNTLLANQTLDVSGQIKRLPDIGQDLTGLPVVIEIDGPAYWIDTVYTYDTFGHYQRPAISAFPVEGIYTITARYPGSALIAPSETAPKTVLVGQSAGYAIIVQGKASNEAGLCSHGKTTNRIYQTLLDRGFNPLNIRYFHYLPAAGCPLTAPSGTDEGNWTKSHVKDAIEVWASQRMINSPAPLHVIWVNHGTPEVFHLGTEEIYPVDLDSWLTTLEGNIAVNPLALEKERQVVLGFCYSGSFIETVSAPGRTIISSAAADEVSHKGPLEDGNIRVGEFFLEALFGELEQGWDWHDAFERATASTEIFTRKGDGLIAAEYSDLAAQHPLLEDNWDGAGSNILSADGDGERARGRYLGVGATLLARTTTRALDDRPYITDVTPAVHLDPGAAVADTSATLWLTNTMGATASFAWVEIRTPDQVIPDSGSSLQQDVVLHKELMTYNSANSRWEVQVNEFFTTAGTYEIFYFVEDVGLQDLLSPMERSLVFKDDSGNAPPLPDPLVLISPAHGASTSTVLGFDWEDATDNIPPGDQVTYNLRIAENFDMTGIVHEQNYLVASSAFVDSGAGLQDLATYHWQVEAVDSYGASTYSPVWSFHTDDTNGISGVIQGLIFSDIQSAAIGGATVLNSIDGILGSNVNSAVLSNGR